MAKEFKPEDIGLNEEWFFNAMEKSPREIGQLLQNKGYTVPDIARYVNNVSSAKRGNKIVEPDKLAEILIMEKPGPRAFDPKEYGMTNEDALQYLKADPKASGQWLADRGYRATDIAGWVNKLPGTKNLIHTTEVRDYLQNTVQSEAKNKWGFRPEDYGVSSQEFADAIKADPTIAPEIGKWLESQGFSATDMTKWWNSQPDTITGGRKLKPEEIAKDFGMRNNYEDFAVKPGYEGIFNNFDYNAVTSEEALQNYANSAGDRTLDTIKSEYNSGRIKTVDNLGNVVYKLGGTFETSDPKQVQAFDLYKKANPDATDDEIVGLLKTYNMTVNDNGEVVGTNTDGSVIGMGDIQLQTKPVDLPVGGYSLSRASSGVAGVDAPWMKENVLDPLGRRIKDFDATADRYAAGQANFYDTALRQGIGGVAQDQINKMSARGMINSKVGADSMGTAMNQAVNQSALGGLQARTWADEQKLGLTSTLGNIANQVGSQTNSYGYNDTGNAQITADYINSLDTDFSTKVNLLGKKPKKVDEFNAGA